MAYGDAAKRARDEALQRVLDNSGDWSDQADVAIRWIVGFRGIGEAIKLRLYELGLPFPHHHNAWGAKIRVWILHGILHDLHTTENMKVKRSHARRSPVYVVRVK